MDLILCEYQVLLISRLSTIQDVYIAPLLFKGFHFFHFRVSVEMATESADHGFISLYDLMRCNKLDESKQCRTQLVLGTLVGFKKQGGR